MAERLDVNIARAQFDRLFDEVIDRAHNRCAAGQVAQVIDILVGACGLAFAAAYRRGCAGIMVVAQNGRDVFERGRYDFKRRSKNDLSRVHRLGVSRIARGQSECSIACFEWE